MRLTTKFALVLVGLSTVVLAGTLGLLYFAERSHLRSQMEADQVSALEKLGRVCADSLIDGNELARFTYLKTLLASAPSGQIAWASLLDDQGRLLMHSDFLRGDMSSYKTETREPALRTAMAAPGFLRQVRRAGGPELTLLSLPVRVGERRAGTATTAYNQEAVDRSLDRIQRESLARFLQAALIGLGLSLAFALALSTALAKPLRELSAGAVEIGKGNLRHRIPESREDELGDLAREFNAMAVKLAELDELKDGFLAQITHDLRNPLGAIIGYVELVMMGGQGPLSERQGKSLRIVLSNGNYLAELINNILDLTKLEAGKMEFSPKEVALRPLVQSVVELMNVKAAEFNVRLDGAAVPEAAAVWADEQALKRVLLNLVSNALKFTPSGGTVSLGWSRLRTGEDCLGVQDTGIGIPKDKLDTLFRKFAQIKETRNKVRESRGTGLGLVICKQIVEGHGGRIWVESEFQKGTTFYFTLPSPSATPQRPAAEASRGR